MKPEQANRASGTAIAFLFAIVFFVVLTAVVRFSINVPPVDVDRGTERAKMLSTIRATEDKSLTTLGWMDQARGIVRLPIDQAIQQAATTWQGNASQARADLTARAEKAAAPAPAAPAKPSAFE